MKSEVRYTVCFSVVDPKNGSLLESGDHLQWVFGQGSFRKSSQRTLDLCVLWLVPALCVMLALETSRLGEKNGSPGEPENAEAERENRQLLADAHGLLGGTDVALGLRPEN